MAVVWRTECRLARDEAEGPPGAVRDHAGGGAGSGRGNLRSRTSPAAMWVELVALLRVRRGLRGTGRVRVT